MCEISVYEAKTQLSKYIALLEKGQEKEIIILKNGKRVAKLVPSLSDSGVRLGAGLLVSEAKPFILKDPAYDMETLFGYKQ
ncbi:MAG: prevent-host-death protein [Erysipelotrichaceae bacterium]|jgi:antitoxin (DNA-binding transcriptional repressor) of toxin-antitoxin stability system|nr:prevent-host-death protein [Erysipelotrichaceae bacterium]